MPYMQKVRYMYAKGQTYELWGMRSNIIYESDGHICGYVWTIYDTYMYYKSTNMCTYMHIYEPESSIYGHICG